MIRPWLFFITTLQIVVVQGVVGYFLPNVAKPMRNEELWITCSLSGTNGVVFYNYNLKKDPISGCNLLLKQCIPPYFGVESNPTYRFGANSSTVWMEILSMDRTRDQGWWRCEDGNNISNYETLNLIVYSSPVGLSFVSPPPPAVDLAESSLTLECKTNSCCFPGPTLIAWYYQTDSGPALLSVGTTRRINSTGSCTQQEKIFSIIIELSRGTSFTGNIPMITTLRCGITHPVFDSIQFSGNSNSVTFAVSLTHVNITGTTDVTQGMESTFNCITSVSRPSATFMWFIGNRTVTKGIVNTNKTDSNGLQYVESRLTFDPNGSIDHGKMIYCQAMTPFDVVTSAKPTLNVRVSLTHVNITGTTDVTQGMKSTFFCTTSISRPPAIVRWFIDNTVVTTGIQSINMTDSIGLPYVESRLTFDPNGTIHHGKDIYCQAMTPFDVVNSTNLTLYVTVYVSDVTLYPVKSNITFLEGDEETLACNSSLARPPPKIRWWLDGVIKTNMSSENTTASGSLQSVTSELRLKLNKTYQNKQIYCDGQVEGQPSPVNSSIAVINVWYKPASPLVKPVNVKFPWLENRTGMLRCVTADRGNPAASVIWSSSRGIKDNDENLVFSNLTDQDNGKAVTCQLQNNYTILKNISIISPNDVTLNVEYTPTITLIPGDKQIRIKERSSPNITCIGTGNPNPKVEWLGRAPPNNVLQFPDVRRNSTGIYTCRANSTSTNFGNVELSQEKSALVVIEYAPDVIVNLNGSTVINSTVLLMCMPLGEPSQYTFHQWIHKVQETEIRRLTGTNTTNTSTLTLSNISIEDMGTYTCTVDNSITGLDGQINQTGHTNIFLHGPPFLGEKELLFTGETNKSSRIEIPFYSNSSLRTVRFTRHSGYKEIINTSDTSIYISPADVKLTFYTKKVMIPGHNAVLVFQNVNDTDFDNFTLLLVNDQGNTSVDLYFIASGPPSVPKKFMLSHYENSLPVFEMEKGFNGGHTQTFIIEYQPVGLPEINWITILKINESGLNNTYLVPIPHIPDGYYIFRVYSQNEKGNSIATEGVNITIKRVQPVSSTTSEFPVAAVAGGIGAAVIVVAIVAIALVVIKRRSSPKQEDLDGDEMVSSKRNHHDSGLVDNPVYESSGLRPDPLTSTRAEYAAVVKPKRPQKVAKEENPSNLYAQVAKKKQKKQKGDIYENADLTKKTFSPDNVYENSADVTTKTYGVDGYKSPGAAGSEFRLANKDGLLYAELMLDPPTSRNGQPVIRGLENRTEYAEIAYGKRGEPLVDNNDEKENSGIS